MADSVEDLLRACTVQVVGGSRGAGFFVAPGIILTCAHVVGGHSRPIVRWARDGQPLIEAYAAGPGLTLDDKGPTIPGLEGGYPDIAVIEVPGLDDHPCVAIDTGTPGANDTFKVYGYPREGGAELLTPARLEYRGMHGTIPAAHLDLADDTIKPGMSGAALLNMRTGAVCGILVATKHPERSDGGLAVHWAAIEDDISDVLAANRAFHKRDQRWSAALARREPTLQLRTPVMRRKPPEFARPLPEHFESRKDLLETTKGELLRPSAGGRARLVGLVGMGGAGKSVLACSLGLDPQVKEAFPDGIVWLEFGPHADLEARQIQLAAKFGVEQPAADSRHRLDNLNAQLARASCLVILDDVWKHEHLRDFDLHVPESALLVTTRDSAVLGQSALVRPVRVPVLAPGAARRLLAGWARQDPSCLPGEAQEVANQCDGLPLALAIAGAMVAGEHSWGYVCESIRNAALDELEFSFIDYQEYKNLFRVLDASVSCLPEQDRDCYLALAVFEGRGDVPVETVFRLWQEIGLNGHKGEHLIIRLAHRSLLKYDSGARTFNMHGLQFVYGRHQLGEDRLQALHARLADNILDAWGGLDDGLPGLCTSSLADPGERYGVVHLSTHLNGADREEDIHRLLALNAPATATANQPGQIRNTWHTAHGRIGETFSYLADVRLAWDLAKASADRAFAAEELATSTGLEIRYALVSASMASITARIPRELIVALVADGQWTIREGRKHAWLLPTAEATARTLVDLLDYVSTAQRRDSGSGPLAAELATEASATAHAVDNPVSRASTLTALVVHAPDLKAAVADAWKAICDIGGEYSRARAVAALAPKTTLPTDLQDQAIRLAGKCEGAYPKAIILTSLVSRSPKPVRPAIVSQAWEAISAISQPKARVDLLMALLPYLPPDGQAAAAKQAREAAEAIPAGFEQASAYLTLAARLLDETDQSDMLSRAQQATGAISQPEEKAAALTALVPLVSSPVSAEQDALAAIDMISSPEATAAALTALAKVRGRARQRVLIERALDAVRAGRQPTARADALADLLALDSGRDDLLNETALAIGEIGQPAARAAACTTAARQLKPGKRRSEMLLLALAEASAIDDADARAAGISTIIPYLPGWDNPAAESGDRRAVDQALADARASGRPKTLASTAAALAPVLPPAGRAAILNEASLAAYQVRDPADRAAALTALIPHLTEGRPAAIAHACAAARQIPHEEQRRRALSAVLAAAPDALSQQARSVTDAADTVRERLDDFSSAFGECGVDIVDSSTIRDAILTNPALALSADADFLQPETSGSARKAVSRSAEEVISAVSELHSQAAALLIMTAADHEMTAADHEREAGISGGPAAVRVIAQALLHAQLLNDKEAQLPAPLHERVQAAIRSVRDAHSQAMGSLPGSASCTSARAQPGQLMPLTETWGATHTTPVPPWHPYWRKVIDDASSRGRSALISELSAIGPVVSRFGGSEAIAEAIAALLDAGRWWP